MAARDIALCASLPPYRLVFTGDAPLFTDPGVTGRGFSGRMGIEDNEMYCHRRHIAFPLFLILAGTTYVMSDSGVIPPVHLHNLWPLLLIAIGLDQIYAWSRSGWRQ